MLDEVVLSLSEVEALARRVIRDSSTCRPWMR